MSPGHRRPRYVHLMNPPGRRFRAVTAASLLALTGCFSYAPIAGVHPARGTHVRATLQTPEDVAITGLTVTDVVELEAEVVRSDADSLVVSALQLRAQSGARFTGRGETVAVPAASVSRMESRQFSLVRSAALVVAAGLGAFLLFEALGGLDGGPSGGKPGPVPQ